MCLQFVFLNFWQKDFGTKAAHKMLVKLKSDASSNGWTQTLNLEVIKWVLCHFANILVQTVNTWQYLYKPGCTGLAVFDKSLKTSAANFCRQVESQIKVICLPFNYRRLTPMLKNAAATEAREKK
jgi:hypothetical protein